MFQEGISTGKTTTHICNVVADVPERNLRPADASVANNQPTAWQITGSCHAETPFLTQFKGLSSYTVPRIAVLVSATYQSLPGTELVLNAAVPSAFAEQTLGRRLSRRPLRAYGLPPAARPLAAKAIREARLMTPRPQRRPSETHDGVCVTGFLNSVATLCRARQVAREALMLCTQEIDPEYYPPEHGPLWFETAIAIDSRVGPFRDYEDEGG